MSRGWWRRNVWGLIFVLPVTAGLFAFNADLLYNVNFATKPTQQAPIDGTGTAVLDDIQVALDSFEPVDDDDSALASRGISLPSSVQAWRAAVTLSGPEDSLSLCTVVLVDAAGRQYPSSPRALPLGAFGCSPDDSDATSPYTSTFYFLLPAPARPQALQISWAPLLPRYVQLPVGAGP